MRKLKTVIILVCLIASVCLAIPKNAYASINNENKKTTRVQLAYTLAEKCSDYGIFEKTEEVLQQVADNKAIPMQYRKAVAFVIEKELMPIYKVLPNEKILFQPNRPVTEEERVYIEELNNSNATSNEYSYLTLVVAVNTTEITVGQEVILIPKLINTTQTPVLLQDIYYSFKIRKIDGTEEYEFISTNGKTLYIPANNSSFPIVLSASEHNWIPTVDGEFIVTQAQVKFGDGEWQVISFNPEIKTK